MKDKERLYLLWWEGDDRYHAYSEEPRLIGIFTTLDGFMRAIEIHAQAYRTNNREPIDFGPSKVVVEVAMGRYFGENRYKDQQPDYSMRVN